jgi:hypothetical protein
VERARCEIVEWDLANDGNDIWGASRPGVAAETQPEKQCDCDGYPSAVQSPRYFDDLSHR